MTFLYQLIFAIHGSMSRVPTIIMQLVARLSLFMAQLFFCLALILLAKGYAILHCQLSRAQLCEMISIAILYGLLQIIILIISISVSKQM
jgi:hypothetical protein